MSILWKIALCFQYMSQVMKVNPTEFSEHYLTLEIGKQTHRYRSEMAPISSAVPLQVCIHFHAFSLKQDLRIQALHGKAAQEIHEFADTGTE